MDFEINRLRNSAISVVTIFLFSITTLLAQQSQKPNIVFILADDLGYGDIAPYGQKLIQTPNLTRLANEGMKYTQFYAGTSVCAPSRSSLMTGLHTGHTPIRGNKEVEPEGQWPIPGFVPTIGELMKKAGYTTGVFGKWGLGFVGSEGDPLQHGIDRFYGYNCQAEAHRYYPTHLWDNETRIELEGNASLKKAVTYAPELIQLKALRFLEENQSKPFMLFLTYTLPHAELLAPEDSLFAMYKGKFGEKPYKGNDYGEGAGRMGYASQRYPHAAFAAMVTRLDTYVGQVMDKLKALGLDEQTLVIFTSDNGPHREGGADPEFFNSGGGLRGVKRDLYEGGIREPFIVRWPGKVEAGAVNNYIGAFWDMLPTFAQLVNEPLSAATDGISFLPSMLGSNQRTHDHLYWEFHENGGKQAVRFGDWKCIRLHVDDLSKATVELYDLSKDEGEQRDIAASYPQVVRKAVSIMDREHVSSKDFPFAGEVKNAPDTLSVTRTGMLVLGSADLKTLRERVNIAYKLYRSGSRFDYIVVSGGCGAHGSTICEASEMAALLMTKGVPAGKIYKEERSKTTVQNYYFSRALKNKDGESVIQRNDSLYVVSNHWHAIPVAARFSAYDGVHAVYHIEGSLAPSPEDKVDYSDIYNNLPVEH